jgi:hypothetical protein
MNPAEAYKLWTPEDSPWSNWVKPVLFADKPVPGWVSGEPSNWRSLGIPWAIAADGTTAIVLDLKGAASVWFGMILSLRGYRPVPLYNGAQSMSALISVDAIVWALNAVSDDLAELRLPPAAPPVFLLDACRSDSGAFATPGRFDNRWCVFPQDFPSANFLLAHGIRSVVLVQAAAVGPRSDLAHVMLRWQEAGIQILTAALESNLQPAPIQVEKPDNFRSLWYRAMVLAGLRRNSAGGFGAVVPEPSSSGGYG